MRRSVAFPTFSLAIESVSHEDAYLYYQVGDKKTEFYAAIGNGKTLFRTSVVTTIPKEITDEEASKIAGDIALGFQAWGMSMRSIEKVFLLRTQYWLAARTVS